jgi:D-3-phosphoglycerate dehydrogenase
MNIVILDDFQDAIRKLPCAEKIASYKTQIYTNNIKGVGQLAVRLRDAEVVVLVKERTPFTRQLIEKLPKLKLVVLTGTQTDHIDIPACTERGIAVAAGTYSPHANAEYTWALLMAAARRIPQYVASLKHGAWQQSGLKAAAMPSNFALGSLLRGKTLGIWSFGRVGQLVAGYGRAFGMDVLVWGSPASQARAAQEGYALAESKADLFARSDYLSIHLRLNKENRHSISFADLSRMKPTATFVNTSNAHLVAPEALVSALNRGRPGLAAIDVFEIEPMMQGQALLRLENCICTPHIGEVEVETYERDFSMAFDNVQNFIRGIPSNIINPGALHVRR